MEFNVNGKKFKCSRKVWGEKKQIIKKLEMLQPVKNNSTRIVESLFMVCRVQTGECWTCGKNKFPSLLQDLKLRYTVDV